MRYQGRERSRIVSYLINHLLREVSILSSKLWDLGVPLIISGSYGFTGVARLQVKEHTVIESHPDNQNPDFRVNHPFPALKEHLESYDLDVMELKDHAHVPYVVILFKYLQEYEKKYGKLPQNYKEKESLKELIRKGELRMIYQTHYSTHDAIC